MKKSILFLSAMVLFGAHAASGEQIYIVKEKSAATHSQKQSLFKGASDSSGPTYKKVKGKTLDELRASGLYESIEPDVKVTTPTPVVRPISPAGSQPAKGQAALSHKVSDAVLFNDPAYPRQWAWHEPVPEFEGYTNLAAAVKGSGGSNRVRIGVVDGSFFVTEDVDYVGGYNFYSDESAGKKPHKDYLQSPGDECGYAHGLAVTAVAAAKQNNDYSIAGIVDADIVAAAALPCGSGSMSEVMDAVRWLSGGRVAGVPDIDRPVDVINMSLGSKSKSMCYSYIQDAINFANSKGISVVVAAGNNAASTADIAPANCNNVIVVGASDKQGNKAGFSNFGREVDVMAPGVDIPGPGVASDSVYLWEGTSVSAPMITGLVALAKTEFPSLTPVELESFLKLTARPMGSGCSGSRCGAGLVAPFEFLQSIREYMNNKNSFMRHVLHNNSGCGENPYAALLGGVQSFCDTVEVTFDDQLATTGERLSPRESYVLYAVPREKPFDISNAKVVDTISAHSTRIKGLEPEAFNYGFTKCSDGLCDKALSRLSMGEALRPQICL